MIIKKMKIGDIQVAEYNPRIDLVEPLIVNKRNNRLVGGHQRLKVLQARGDTEVQVSIVDLDEPHEKALNLALNKTGGDWDQDKLSALLSELSELSDLGDLPDFDIDMTGFDLDEIGEILPGPESEEDDFNVDEAIDEIETAITQPGDLIILGRHRLLCGDATKEDDVNKLMDGQKADMVFTDPPYNVAYGDSNNPRYTAHVSGKHKLILNDNMPTESWIEFNKKLINIIKNNSTGDIYIWGAPGPDGMRARLTYIDNGCHWSATIIWKKNRLVLAMGKYQRIYEPCFYGWFDKSSFVADRKQIELWEIDRPTVSELHPTMKPVLLAGTAIENSCLKNKTVLDLFGGSGTTLISCDQLDRSCYMMELDPIYCDVIVKRWEALTGEQAQR